MYFKALFDYVIFIYESRNQTMPIGSDNLSYPAFNNTIYEEANQALEDMYGEAWVKPYNTYSFNQIYAEALEVWRFCKVFKFDMATIPNAAIQNIAIAYKHYRTGNSDITLDTKEHGLSLIRMATEISGKDFKKLVLDNELEITPEPPIGISIYEDIFAERSVMQEYNEHLQYISQVTGVPPKGTAAIEFQNMILSRLRRNPNFERMVEQIYAQEAGL